MSVLALLAIASFTATVAASPLDPATAQVFTCPTPAGTIDRPVVNGAYVPGQRAPLLTWTTTCPNLTDFRLVWSFIRSNGTYTSSQAWEGRATSFQIPEPADQAAVAVSFMLQNRDLQGGAGVAGAQVPLQVIPPSAPGVPTLVDNGEGRVTVSWTPPQSDGGATVDYTVTTTPTTTGCTTAETSCLVTDLKPDARYDVVVKAANSAGTGPASAARSITPAAPRLLAPTRVTARASGSTIAVTWRPPSGEQTSTPVRYVVTSRPAGLNCRTDATSCTFRRLKPGTSASFTITAIRGTKRTASRPSPTVRTPVPPPPTPAPVATQEPTPKPPQELS
jgi:hypothetical protein